MCGLINLRSNRPFYRCIAATLFCSFLVNTAVAKDAPSAATTLPTDLTTTSEVLNDTLSAISVLAFAHETCKQPGQILALATYLLNTTPQRTDSKINFRGTEAGQRVTLSTDRQSKLEIQLLRPPARRNQYLLTSFRQPTIKPVNAAPESPAIHQQNSLPELLVALNADCELRQAMRIVYDIKSDQALFIEPLNQNAEPIGSREWLNPELPAPPQTAKKGLAVAMIDSGVNYSLDEIANSLARDKRGRVIGFDFWDMDDKPFDANPARSPFVVQRHGTRTASIVIREAPGVRIIPYRYPRPDMTRMTALVEHAAKNKVRIAGMPLGSNRYSDWTSFASAAAANPQILFIVSAGNNGRDIDQTPVYPAAMDIDNMIVVTSSDDFAVPAERTNYGRMSVDYLVPAEAISALDYSGETTEVSGSSYAVSRIVALAARILANNPSLTTDELKSAIKQQSIRANTARYVSVGYLGDPLADTAKIDISGSAYSDTAVDILDIDYELPINIVVLDDRWKAQQIESAIQELNSVFAQCSIVAVARNRIDVKTDDYLKDLASGHALTLKRKLKLSGTTVYFGRDTRMQTEFDAEAFGIANTGNRPWMTNSLWLTYGIQDTGIALAHELFHIIANSGAHSTLDNNLLRDQTAPGNTLLSEEQCARALEAGTHNGLLQ